MKAAARIFLIAALMVSIGAHWGLLQIAAWAGMAKAYSAEKGLVEGLKETFDGAHPCSMCKKIGTAKETDQQQKHPVSKSGQNELSKWLSLSSAMLTPQSRWNDGGAVVQREARAPHFYEWNAGPAFPPPKVAA